MPPFDPTGPGSVTPVKRIKPIYASDIGDSTAGGSNNVQAFIDLRRRYRGAVVDISARPASSLVNGDWVIVLDAGAGEPELHVYLTSDTAWHAISGSGSGGSGTSVYYMGAHGPYVELERVVGSPTGTATDGTTADTTFQLPYSGLSPQVIVGAVEVQMLDEDFTLVPASGQIVFVAGRIPPNDMRVFGTSILYGAGLQGAGLGYPDTWSEIGTGDSTDDGVTGTTDFPLPGSGLAEQIMVGGVPVLRGEDYEVVDVLGVQNARFFTGSIPLAADVGHSIPAQKIHAICASSAIVDGNAVTLGGLSTAFASDPNTIPKRGALGTMNAVKRYANAAALAAVTMVSTDDGHMVEVAGSGVYRLIFGDTTAANGGSVLAIGGGRAHQTASLGGTTTLFPDVALSAADLAFTRTYTSTKGADTLESIVLLDYAGRPCLIKNKKNGAVISTETIYYDELGELAAIEES